MNFKEDLNEEQLQGVTCDKQYIKVIAGAGSGKTRVLTYRIAYLISQKSIMPYQILGITFTNKAAKEIKDRVNKLIPGSEYMDLSTIHSWCAKFLRKYAEVIDYPRNFTIIDEDDQRQIMKNIFVGHGKTKNDPQIKECLSWIGSKKNEGLQFKDLEGTHYPNPLINEFLGYFKEYTAVLKKTASLDFDDLLLKSIEILEDTRNGIKENVSKKYKHILVDEFQDIDDVQFYLISLLMNKDTNLYVVGDPDQTIYTWRGANNKIMLDLENKINSFFKGAHVETIIMHNNYRSSKNILTCANRLIDNNLDRIKKDLFAVNPDGQEITFINARTVGEEASYVASTIDELVKNHKATYNSFAVLYRSNYLTREIESQFALRRIPYRLFGGLKFYQRREIKDVISYLNIFINILDDQSLERIINVPKRNIGPTSLDKLKENADKYGVSLYLLIKENSDKIELNTTKVNALTKMVEEIEKTKELLQKNKSSEFRELINAFLERIGYYSYLKKEEDGDDRVDNVKELMGTISLFFTANKDASFEDFVTNAVLQSSTDEINEGNYVSLMTVHTAKGLEFDSVFIYGFNQDVFPSKRAIDERAQGIEEERRLAYVAITRAKKKLYITCNQDFSYVNSGYLRPSQFLKEAGINVKNYSQIKSNYINPLKINLNNKKVNVNVAPAINKTNGVDKWYVGDKLSHEQFGVGVVKKVLSDKLIEVEFENSEYGNKTLLSNHFKIKKLYN